MGGRVGEVFAGQVDLPHVTAWSLTRDDAAREVSRALNRIFYLNTTQALHQF